MENAAFIARDTDGDTDLAATTEAALAAPKNGFDAQVYHDVTRLVERMHRRFLDVLRTELARLDINDINAVQCLLLSNIGVQEINVRNLMEKGYYLGSNASYNIKKLVESGYLNQERSPHDRRSTNLKLSKKGLELCQQIRVAEDELSSKIAEIDIDLNTTLDTLRRIERVWADHMRYR